MHLVVIDMQEKLFPHIHEKDEVLLNTYKLVKAFEVLGLPITFTEQIKLGETIKPLSNLAKDVVKKTSFSCMGEDEFLKRIMGDRVFVLTGIETHICVLQTAIDMLKYGFKVFVSADCTSSRKEYDKNIAIKRMIQEGIKISTSESIIYEILRDAKHEKFKEILNIVKMKDVQL